MNWDEIKEMRECGIEFGSHGKSHEIMTHLSHDKMRIELIDSKEIIERNLKTPVLFWAYPNHNFDNNIKRMVEEAGYLAAGAGGSRPGETDRFDLYNLKRANVNEGATLGPTGMFSRAIFAWKMACW